MASCAAPTPRDSLYGIEKLIDGNDDARERAHAAAAGRTGLWFGLGLALCLIGLVISGYLFAPTGLCSSCDKPLAIILGNPLAGWGILFFGTLALLLVVAWSLAGGFMRRAAHVGCLVAVAGALTGLWLTALFVLGRVPWCPLCSVTHLLAGSLVVVFWLLARSSPRSAPGILDVAGFAGIAIGAAVILLLVRQQAAPRRGPVDTRGLLLAYENAQAQVIPIRPDDARLGPLNASVRVVAFSNFRCSACREFALSVRALADAFRDELVICFKHYPLSTDCDPRASVDLHPGSCQAAWAAEAARRQGKFWEFHDRLSRVGAGEPQLLKAARALGLDLERFREDRHSEDVRRKVAADLELGSRLGVDGVPSVFVNGRRVHDLRPTAMALIISHAAEKR